MDRLLRACKFRSQNRSVITDANPAMSIKELLSELKAAYAKAGLNCGDGLHSPASPEAIERIEASLAMPVPEELRAVLQLHGGQDYIAPGITGLFGSHRLHTPEEILEKHKLYQTHCLLDPLPEYPPQTGESGYWNPALIPFASWDAYDLCIHSYEGDVWEFCPNIGLTEHGQNMRSLLQKLIDSVLAGNEPTPFPIKDSP